MGKNFTQRPRDRRTSWVYVHNQSAQGCHQIPSSCVAAQVQFHSYTQTKTQTQIHTSKTQNTPGLAAHSRSPSRPSGGRNHARIHRIPRQRRSGHGFCSCCCCCRVDVPPQIPAWWPERYRLGTADAREPQAAK